MVLYNSILQITWKSKDTLSEAVLRCSSKDIFVKPIQYIYRNTEQSFQKKLHGKQSLWRLFLNCFVWKITKATRDSVFFSIWVFFHKHSWIIGLQGNGEGISSAPHYHFHLLHRHLDISQVITAESSPLYIASSQAQTRNLWFLSAIC